MQQYPEHTRFVIAQCCDSFPALEVYFIRVFQISERRA